MNRTSTLAQLWRIDCESFRRMGASFELRNVDSPAHESFVRQFAALHALAYDRDGSTVTFFPAEARLAI